MTYDVSPAAKLKKEILKVELAFAGETLSNKMKLPSNIQYWHMNLTPLSFCLKKKTQLKNNNINKNIN